MYLVLGKKMSYLVREYSEGYILKMLDFLIDNSFVEFDGQVFQQIVGIQMYRNCAPLLADLLSYPYEAEFIQGLFRNKQKITRALNFTFRYIDDVLPLNKSIFSEHLDQIYPSKIENKGTTDSTKFA